LVLTLTVPAAFALVACGGPPPPPAPLAPLRLPGVVAVSGVSGLHVGPGRGVIGQVAAYEPAGGAAAPRVLFTEDGELFDVGLDGTGLRSLRMSCDGPIAVAPGGRWVVCQTDGGIAISDLTAKPPDGGALLLTSSAYNPSTGLLGSPAWSPDGRLLAVVTTLASGCAVGVYVTTLPYRTIGLATVLDFPSLVLPGASRRCAISGLAWSPDGRWLAFTQFGDHRPYEIDGLLLASLPPLGTRPVTPPTTITVPARLLVPLGRSEVFAAPPSWSVLPSGLALTYPGPSERSIMRGAVPSGAAQTVLAVGQGTIDALAWTPDGHGLVFAQGDPGCAECAVVYRPSQLYVYTPPSA
jgi:hypothetical protein